MAALLAFRVQNHVTQDGLVLGDRTGDGHCRCGHRCDRETRREDGL